MPCPVRAIAVCLSSLLAFVAGTAQAADPAKRPLQLKPASTPMATRGTVTMAARPGRIEQVRPSLGERALESLLDDAGERNARAQARGDVANFQFKRRGDAGRDIAQGYNDMCETVSQKLWDEPNGKRVRFDVAGKPGVALEIPLR